jgi:hypothetical protein
MPVEERLRLIPNGRDKPSFQIPRIEVVSGFAYLGFMEIPLQDMIHDSKFSPYRYFSVGSQERRMQTRHIGLMVITRVVSRQHGGPFRRSVWDPGIIFSFSLAQSMERQVVMALLEDKQSREGRIVMSLS